MDKNRILILAMMLVLAVFACRVLAQTKDKPKQPADSAMLPIMLDEVPIPIKQVQPSYPETAIKAKLEGTVWLKVLVNKLGTVDSVIVSQPTPALAELERAAVDAAKQWVFKPGIQKGKPVATWIFFPTKFLLKAKEEKQPEAGSNTKKD